MQSKNIIGIDFGQKNIGLAIGEKNTKSTKPIKVIKIPKNQSYKYLINEIIEIINHWQAKSIIIGLPAQTKINNKKNDKNIFFFNQIKNFAQLLQKTYKSEFNQNIKIFFHSEIYSTKISNKGLSKNQKKNWGDAFAAENILRSWLDI